MVRCSGVRHGSHLGHPRRRLYCAGARRGMAGQRCIFYVSGIVRFRMVHLCRGRREQEYPPQSQKIFAEQYPSVGAGGTAAGVGLQRLDILRG